MATGIMLRELPRLRSLDEKWGPISVSQSQGRSVLYWYRTVQVRIPGISKLDPSGFLRRQRLPDKYGIRW